MAKETVTTNVDLDREVSDSELVRALQRSMVEVFRHFETELGDWRIGKVLDIRVTAAKGGLKLEYGIGDAVN